MTLTYNSKILPDIEVVGLGSRLDTINQILSVTSKPMIVDGDTGGDLYQFEYMVNRLEQAGISMVIVEDKRLPKWNSLLNAEHHLEKIERFAEKIQRGIHVRQNKDFMIVARLESLIVGHSVAEAIERARLCLMARVDGIAIHCKSPTADDVFAFAKQFYTLPNYLIEGKVLISTISNAITYKNVRIYELENAGFHMVIYTNHLFRAAYKAMEDTCKSILYHGKTDESEASLIPVGKLFEVVSLVPVHKKRNAGS